MLNARTSCIVCRFVTTSVILTYIFLILVNPLSNSTEDTIWLELQPYDICNSYQYQRERLLQVTRPGRLTPHKLLLDRLATTPVKYSNNNNVKYKYR